MTTIEDITYARCNLFSVFIPQNVTYIGIGAFCDCENLSCIEVAWDNQYYDSRNDCNAIICTATNELIAGCNNTIIPEGVTRIGYAAFVGCTSLTSITIPNSVTLIDDTAFGDTRLNSVTVLADTPPVWEEFCHDSFSSATLYVPLGTRSLYAIADVWKDFGQIIELETMPDYFTVPNSDGVAIRYHKLSDTACEVTSLRDERYTGSITIPSSVTYAGHTFTVTAIGNSAFDDSYITSITLPSTLTSTGEQAFDGCNRLTTVTTYANTPPTVGSDAFNGVSLSSATLFVPIGTKSAYAAAAQWKNFGTILEFADPAHLDAVNFALYFDDTDIARGHGVDLAIRMKNATDDITAAAFVIELPEGITVATDEDGTPLVTLVDERCTTTHVVSANLEGNILKVATYSLKSKPFKGTEGELLKVSLQAASNVPTGKYSIALQEVELTRTNATVAEAPCGMGTLQVNLFQWGDVNCDDEITISDAIGIINLWLKSDLDGLNPELADANRDGKVSITDAVHVINIILSDDEFQAPRRHAAQRDIASAEASLRMPDTFIGTDRYAELPITLQEANAITAIQGELTLPSGVHLAEVTTQRGHFATWNEQPDGSIRIAIVSLQLGRLDASLPALTLHLECDATFQSGTVTLTDADLTTPDVISLQASSASALLTRDVNAIEQLQPDDAQQPLLRFDLMGRRISQDSKGQFYFEQGRSLLIK